MPSKQGQKKLMGALALSVGFASIALQPTVLSAQDKEGDRRLETLYPGLTNYVGDNFDKGSRDNSY